MLRSLVGSEMCIRDRIRIVVVINKKELIITNTSAELAFILPFGISRISEVLGFAVSISLSIYLLKAIAAERAKTIQSITYVKVSHLKLD